MIGMTLHQKPPWKLIKLNFKSLYALITPDLSYDIASVGHYFFFMFALFCILPLVDAPNIVFIIFFSFRLLFWHYNFTSLSSMVNQWLGDILSGQLVIHIRRTVNRIPTKMVLSKRLDVSASTRKLNCRIELAGWLKNQAWGQVW